MNDLHIEKGDGTLYCGTAPDEVSACTVRYFVKYGPHLHDLCAECVAAINRDEDDAT